MRFSPGLCGTQRPGDEWNGCRDWLLRQGGRGPGNRIALAGPTDLLTPNSAKKGPLPRTETEGK